jgi:hypothetical protein
MASASLSITASSPLAERPACRATGIGVIKSRASLRPLNDGLASDHVSDIYLGERISLLLTDYLHTVPLGSHHWESAKFLWSSLRSGRAFALELHT